MHSILQIYGVNIILYNTMNSIVTASTTSDQNRPEENLSSKPNSTASVQKTPVSLLQVISMKHNCQFNK